MNNSRGDPDLSDLSGLKQTFFCGVVRSVFVSCSFPPAEMISSAGGLEGD